MAFSVSGKRDRLITLQIATRSQDDDGAPILLWPPEGGQQYAFWAQWVPTSTREDWNSQERPASYVDGVFRFDGAVPKTLFMPDATRILFDDKVFDVRPYIELARGQGWEVGVVARGEGGT